VKDSLGLADFCRKPRSFLLDSLFVLVQLGCGLNPKVLVEFLFSGREITGCAFQPVQQGECLIDPKLATHNRS
jgi:hypothetical protein